MTKKALTLSIVIPVYNEEDYLTSCLDSIAAQSVKPDEVIVVDNNSTDGSVAVAKAYPFVKVVHEKRQGQVFAQDTGFAATKSDILGRIDADSILPRNWVSVIKKQFALDDSLVAVTGPGRPFDVAAPWIGAALFNFYHHSLSGLLAGHTMMWGANFAVKRTDWQKVRSSLSMRTDIWEDFDLSFCLAPLGKIQYLHGLVVGCSLREAHKTVRRNIKYQYRAVRTYKLHKNILVSSIFLFFWSSLFLLLPLALLDKVLTMNSRN